MSATVLGKIGEALIIVCSECLANASEWHCLEEESGSD